MSTKNENIDPLIENDEIHIGIVIKLIWKRRVWIYWSFAISFLIGVIISFSIPKTYESGAVLLPSADKKSTGLGNLSSLAGIAGINFGSLLNDPGVIPTNLYPQVVNSYPFLNTLIQKKFNYEEMDSAVTMLDYLSRKKEDGFGSLIIKYTIKLPWTIKDQFRSHSPTPSFKSPDNLKVLIITPDEGKAINHLSRLLQVTVDQKTKLIYLTAEESEPLLSAQLAQHAIDALQKFVIDYKTSQIRNSLEFVQTRHDEIKKEYELAQKALFDYRDKNRDIVSDRVDITYQRLVDAYDISSGIYKALTQQLEQTKIAVKEETPVFTVLKPVMIPDSPSSPKKVLIVLVSCFLGVIICIGTIVIVHFQGRIVHSFKQVVG